MATESLQHDTGIADKVEELFYSTEFSDLVLVVEGQLIPSHKLVLSCRSEYFRNLLHGSQGDVKQLQLTDTPLSSFIVLLQYIYTGRVSLDSEADSHCLLPTMLDVLALAHRYSFLQLEQSVSKHLKQIMSARNFPVIYEYARGLEWSDLAEACLTFADDNAQQVVSSQTLVELSSELLGEVISRDSFTVAEVAVFEAVCAWHQRHPDLDLAPLLSAVRLSQMTQQELLNVVLPTRLLTSEVILEAFQQRRHGTTSPDCQPRHLVVMDENIATMQRGVILIEGACLQLDKRKSEVDKEKILANWRTGKMDESKENEVAARRALEYVYYFKSNINSPDIVVELGHPYLINCIRMTLGSIGGSRYSYYVEVSINKEDWTKVIDYRDFLCVDLQLLHFKPQAVKYIRVVSTYSEYCVAPDLKPCITVKDFQCFYMKDPAACRDGFMYAPNELQMFVRRVDEESFICCSQPCLMDTVKIQDFAGSIRVRGRDPAWQEVKSNEGEAGCFAFEMREVSCIDLCPEDSCIDLVDSELDLNAVAKKIVCLATSVPEPQIIPEPQSMPEEIAHRPEEFPAAPTTVVATHQPPVWHVAVALVLCLAIFLSLFEF